MKPIDLTNKRVEIWGDTHNGLDLADMIAESIDDLNSQRILWTEEVCDMWEEGMLKMKVKNTTVNISTAEKVDGVGDVYFHLKKDWVQELHSFDDYTEFKMKIDELECIVKVDSFVTVRFQ